MPKRLEIRVITGSKTESVTQNPDGTLTVHVHAPPTEGKANARVIELLAKYFNFPLSLFRIKRGLTGKRKVIEVVDTRRVK